MDKTSQHIHAFLLAAGASKRFGGIKLLAPMPVARNISSGMDEHESLIQHSVRQIHKGLFDSYTVVLGANAEAINAALKVQQQQWGFNTLINPNWQQGMGVTIATAVSHATSTHIAICAADQIALKSEHFARLVEASQRHPDHIVAAKYGGRLGVPCIFPRVYYEQLKNLTADTGAKALLATEKQNIISVELPEAIFDIDTPDDLIQFTC